MAILEHLYHSYLKLGHAFRWTYVVYRFDSSPKITRINSTLNVTIAIHVQNHFQIFLSNFLSIFLKWLGKKLVFQHTINLPWEIGRQILTQRPKTSHSKRHAPLEIFLAGPYGAPASGLFYRQVDHAVLIATGIGVTPFASILQSIMFKFGESRKRLPNISISQSYDLPIGSTE